MELHIKSDFDCVYLINGEFTERADTLTMSEYDVVYVTVFPLKHTFLPYTVKFVGTQNIHTELATGVRLSSEHYLLSLAPLYPMVYAGGTAKYPQPKSHIARVFASLKAGDGAGAYAMLSEQLKTSISRDTLIAFFADYETLCECDWEPGKKFYLVDKNGAARLHEYTLDGEFIDDIRECD